MHRLHHVGLTVPDLEAAADFHVELLGSTVVEHNERDDHATVQKLIDVPVAEIKARMLQLPPDDRLELIEEDVS